MSTSLHLSWTAVQSLQLCHRIYTQRWPTIMRHRSVSTKYIIKYLLHWPRPSVGVKHRSGIRLSVCLFVCPILRTTDSPVRKHPARPAHVSYPLYEGRYTCYKLILPRINGSCATKPPSLTWLRPINWYDGIDYGGRAVECCYYH